MKKYSSLFNREKLPIVVAGVFLVLFLLGTPVDAVKISNIEFNLEDSPGSTSTQEFVVTNDEDQLVNVTINVGDWYRNLRGSNQFIDENAARWKAPRRAMSEGEELTISYKAEVPGDFSGDFAPEGELSVSRPEEDVTVYGDVGYEVGSGEVISEAGGDGDAPVTVTREINPVQEGNEVTLEITVNIVANEQIRGITLSEKFPVNTELTNVDSSGIPIEYVNRSAADWIEVEPREFSLNPGEEREIQFNVSVPQRVEGTHWAAIYVRSEPADVEGEGTQIVAVKRFAVKVYENIPATGNREAFVTDFSAITTSIPKFNLGLKNEGNVQLEFSGELRLRDETGEVVDSIEIDTFPLLPGYERKLTIEGEEVTQLPPGKYNAVAILDYGAENRIGKTVSFEVKPLDLKPIGSSPSPPQDINDDGLYEDIDGNGKLEQVDALVFSFNYDSPVVQDNARAFDFNLDGSVNMDDANELMRMAEENN